MSVYNHSIFNVVHALLFAFDQKLLVVLIVMSRYNPFSQWVDGL